MTPTDIKSSLHKIIDRIENPQLLQTLYDFLKSRKNSGNGELWESLSAEQKEELLLSFEKSENDEELIDRRDLWKDL